MEARRPTYERLATFSVQTAGRTPQDVAAEIAQRLNDLNDKGHRNPANE
jgi:shikimate kinase